jgi:zinc protease
MVRSGDQRAMTGQLDVRSDVPPRTGLTPVRSTLENGAVVIAKQTARTPAVTISLAVNAGSVYDSRGLAGGMHLVARTIDRGTLVRTADQIADELENRGVALTVGVTRHQTLLTCTALARDFEPVLAVLADIVRNPVFPESELATRKGEVITSIRQDEDSPFVRASEGLMTMLYGDDHPYGWRTKGDVEQVQRVGRTDLIGLHARWFVPAALTAVIVGDVETSRTIAVTEALFGDWSGQPVAPPELPSPPPPLGRRQRVIAMPNKAQSDVAYGFIAVARSDPEFYAYFLMNNVLGQYALGGRLGDSIRERQGMAYYVSSALEASPIPGPLAVRAGVSAANVDRTIASIDAELARVRAEGLTATEILESQQFLAGSLPRMLETNAGIATLLQTAEFFDLGLDFDVRLPHLLRGVTLDQANAAARAVLDPDRATFVIAGPYGAAGPA